MVDGKFVASSEGFDCFFVIFVCVVGLYPNKLVWGCNFYSHFFSDDTIAWLISSGLA